MATKGNKGNKGNKGIEKIIFKSPKPEKSNIGQQRQHSLNNNKQHLLEIMAGFLSLLEFPKIRREAHTRSLSFQAPADMYPSWLWSKSAEPLKT